MRHAHSGDELGVGEAPLVSWNDERDHNRKAGICQPDESLKNPLKCLFWI